MKNIFVVLTRVGHGWVNTWSQGDGPDRVPLWFESRAEAQEELDDHLASAADAGLDYEAEDFRIVKVSHTHEHFEG